MSIVLTHAYYLYEDAKEQAVMKPYAPLGLLYISGYLNENNVENHLYDSTFYSKEEQLIFIEEKQPKVVAIYTNLMTKINVIKLVKILKTEKKYGFPKLILGGPDITYNCENYLNTGVDFLIIGEGEQTTLELYNAIKENNDFSKITGIAYLENGSVVKTPPRIKMKDLSELPLPNRAAIPVDKYLSTWKTHHGKSSMTISTQRGCPYTCKWCSTAVYGQSYRRRPAKMVAAEMLMLKQTYNTDSIWFVDDVFTVSHKWIKEFHEEVLKQNATIPFECITRAERLTDEVLQLLKEAGCFRIWIGAESGSQKIIDAMDRRVDVDVVKSAIKKTNEIGMETGTFIMVGYPGEDEQDINETITYLKAANPTHFTITVAYPIKGTSLYNEIEDQITVKPNWDTSTDRDIDFTRTYSRKFYDYAVRRIVNEVNFNKEILKGRNKNLLTSFKLKTKSIIAQTGMKLYKG
ncbi:B12-binding domain-containing radical SAM protein [Winogradskyella echinorum]|uniref:B12-binding domain-containing radical SAM protein n=1 Tax=Winogradskyella echinorum TaxID=538189 RepID=A0ABR6XYR6_9FLAO|nr:radical SAM protein [Winogradskyella echinorum]MBC3845569.1 B12-binding domain-containing radical SAM protein [Winogradskyella echinorum]MBC5749917.1 B12-binding domain-containing radical SAM protein [Winogradskyella echinorum]